MDDEGKKKYIIERIRFIMDMAEMPWFYCFGKLQSFVISRGTAFDMNYDIDIGIICDKSPMDKITSIWQSEGYEMKSALINDVTGEPLNIHFVPTESDMKGTPSIDMFVWVRKGKRLYHTYDVKRERQRIPKEYIFKGVPAKFLDPDKDLVKMMQKKDQSLRDDGTWEYSIFGEYSGYLFRLPFAYGSLLDIWYPGWLFPANKNFESETPDIIKVKSCGSL